VSGRTEPCDHCDRKFADANAVRQHIRHRHPQIKGVKRARASAPAQMTPSDAYDFVDSLGLPDGAHWAMLEELTGLEPAEFAFLGDGL
jgi:hypothetical protein